MMMLNSKVSSVNHLLSTGLSPARAEGRCAAKKMAKNKVPPQIFFQCLLYIIYKCRPICPTSKPSPGGQFLETALIREMLFVSFQCLFFILANGIECYVCTGQEHNDDKCIKTVNTCLQDQSVCMTRVEWRCKYIYYLPTSLR